jgi:hypothetical protein
VWIGSEAFSWGWGSPGTSQRWLGFLQASLVTRSSKSCNEVERVWMPWNVCPHCALQNQASAQQLFTQPYSEMAVRRWTCGMLSLSHGLRNPVTSFLIRDSSMCLPFLLSHKVQQICILLTESIKEGVIHQTEANIPKDDERLAWFDIIGAQIQKLCINTCS